MLANPIGAKKCFESHLNKENIQNSFSLIRSGFFSLFSGKTKATFKEQKEDKKEGVIKRKASPEPFSVLEEKLSKLSETDFEKA